MASENKPIAVRQVFKESNWDIRPVRTIGDVFDDVQSGAVTAGVVPFENSTNGSVVFTLDYLADHDGRFAGITVDGEIYVDVRHYLVGHVDPSAPPLSAAPGDSNDDNSTVTSSALGGAGGGGSSTSRDGSGTCTPTAAHPVPAKPRAKPATSLAHVRRLYSHPQAFGQCDAFVSAYLKGADIFDVSSTSKAAEVVAGDETGTWAAISSGLASDMYGLDVLATSSIEDRADNTTRFLIIGRNPSVPDDWDLVKASIARSGSKSLVSFTVPHTAPGALADVLGCFREFNLNMTSINSRPSLKAPFQYIFFVEFEGHRFDDPGGRVKGALDKISEVAETWRWLGSWERYR